MITKEKKKNRMASSIATETIHMNDGEDSLSYSKNSSIQRGALESSKTIIVGAIASHLDVECFSPLHRFTIADVGCSTGPNTFLAVQNILNAVETKYQNSAPASLPEFLVHFNDHTFNDFNTLFRSMPVDKHYFAAAVAGSFYGRLFPKASLHFVHASYALHWLSSVPNELLDKESPAWNQGRVTYANAPKEVSNAFSAQFEKDMTSFLNARAQEIVPGGLMALLILACPDEVPSNESALITKFHMLGSCLTDMAKLGFVNEADIDSFNIPIYNTSPKQMKQLIERNGGFSIEIMEALINRTVNADVEIISKHVRAATETLFKKHFGSEVMDELYRRYTQKLADSSFFSQPYIPPNELVIVLKRKVTE